LPNTPFLVDEEDTSTMAASKSDVPTKPTTEGESFLPQRRVSSRVPATRSVPFGPVARRSVQDRWTYEPVIPQVQEFQGSSDINDDLVSREVRLFLTMAVVPDMTILGPVLMAENDHRDDRPFIPLTTVQRRLLMKRFNAEGKRRRRLFRIQLIQEWESTVAPAYDQENADPKGETMVDEEIVFDGYLHERLAQFDSDLDLQKTDFIDTLSCAVLSAGRFPDGITGELPTDIGPDDLLLRRTAELWAGLRRVYFGEVEDPIESENVGPGVKRPRTRENVAEFKREIADTRARIRRLEPPVPDDLNVPTPFLPFLLDDSDDEEGPDVLSALPLPHLLFHLHGIGRIRNYLTISTKWNAFIRMKMTMRCGQLLGR
jgi:hypothetical protein